MPRQQAPTPAAGWSHSPPAHNNHSVVLAQWNTLAPEGILGFRQAREPLEQVIRKILSAATMNSHSPLLMGADYLHAEETFAKLTQRDEAVLRACMHACTDSYG